MSFKVVIPARFASTRLPGKPLADIAGLPMIEHVYRRAIDSGAQEVVIATDHADVQAAAKAFGASVCMTSAQHGSGTERLSEVIDKMGWAEDEIIVNLQGDEPLMPGRVIRQVAQNLRDHPQASVATLCERITTAAELFDPHAVKVVFDQRGLAVYFSRAPIPWDRDAFVVTTQTLPERSKHYRHVGLYAYRAALVKEYVTWPACELEAMESLEQLRVLWHGRKVHVAEAVEKTPPGVDTEEDLAYVRSLLEKST